MNKRQRKKLAKKVFQWVDLQTILREAVRDALEKSFESAAWTTTPPDTEQERPPLPPGKNYCARCGQVCGFSEEWKKKHAVIEREAYFGSLPEEEYLPVCEDCWHEVMPVITVSQN